MTALSTGTLAYLPSVQYFATTPNNGVFGPVSKLVHLHGARPTSATARPLSALAGGRASRAEGRSSRLAHGDDGSSLPRPPSAHGTPSTDRVRRRMSGVPMPSPGPRTTPRRSLGGAAAPPATSSPAPAVPPLPPLPTPSRPAHGFATPQVPRVVSTPRRPTSAVAHRRPASVLHRSTTQYSDDAFVFDDAPRPAKPPQDARQGLLEQLSLNSAGEAGSLEDAVVPMAVYERLCDELADVRKQLARTEREHAAHVAETEQHAQTQDDESHTQRSSDAQRYEAAEAKIAELQRQLAEAIDTATAAVDAHDELEHASSEHTKRIATLEKELQAAQALASEAPGRQTAEALAELQAKMASLTNEWDTERTKLTDEARNAQDAARERAAEEAQRLDEAQRVAHEWQQKVEQLEAQLASHDTDASQSAAAIDLESLREQLQHLHDKVAALEVELSEARADLERERTAHQASATAHADALKKQQEQDAANQARLDEYVAQASRAEAHAAELQEALDECRAALERERAEIERLREAPATPQVPAPDTSALTASAESDVVRALELRLAQVERAKAEEYAHFTKEIAELESLVESRIFREDELETELERLRLQQGAT